MVSPSTTLVTLTRILPPRGSGDVAGEGEAMVDAPSTTGEGDGAGPGAFVLVLGAAATVKTKKISELIPRKMAAYFLLIPCKKSACGQIKLTTSNSDERPNNTSSIQNISWAITGYSLLTPLNFATEV